MALWSTARIPPLALDHQPGIVRVDGDGQHAMGRRLPTLCRRRRRFLWTLSAVVTRCQSGRSHLDVGWTSITGFPEPLWRIILLIGIVWPSRRRRCNGCHHKHHQLHRQSQIRARHWTGQCFSCCSGKQAHWLERSGSSCAAATESTGSADWEQGASSPAHELQSLRAKGHTTAVAVSSRSARWSRQFELYHLDGTRTRV